MQRTLIVEDDHEFQVLLSESLDFIGGNWRTYSYNSGRDACSFVARTHGNLSLALVDLGLPDMDGTEVISTVRKRFPETPILVISVIKSSRSLFRALSAGATGYLLKDDTALGIAESIKEVMKGNSPISPLLVRKIIARMAPPEESLINFEVQLSDREEELLRCISEGLNYSAAAQAMGLTITTVHSYSKRLFRKLGVKSKSQAILCAQRHGLIRA